LSFETFTAVMFHVEVFWVAKPCSDVIGYHRFVGLCCLHLQGEVEAGWASEMLVSYQQHYTASQPRRHPLET